MEEKKLLSVAEFAELAGISKQAVYKQVNNENSQIAPFVIVEGKVKLIKSEALTELYKVETTQATQLNQQDNPKSENTTHNQPIINPQVETDTTPINPHNQPISTDYIEFLKSQISDLKAEKSDIEKRLNATISEKDTIIKEQSAQLAQLAQQVANIADKALITTSQQQYLAVADKVVESAAEPMENKKGFFNRLFNW